MTKTYYTSGEFATLFKLNKKTLEHYRKIGLFLPQKTDSNGYFRYSHHQIDLLYTILSLKKLNLSLSEIKKILGIRTPESLIELLEEKTIIAQEQLYELSKIKNYLTETIDFTKRGISFSNRLTITHEEEEHLLVAKENTVSTTKKYQIEFEEATFSPDTSCIGTMRQLNSTNEEAQIFLKLYKNKKLSNKVKKSGLYASNIHKGPHDLIDRTYGEMKKEIQELGYEIGNLAYEEYLIDDVATNDQEQYITLIKIEVE